jgi:hypothetical protein
MRRVTSVPAPSLCLFALLLLVSGLLAACGGSSSAPASLSLSLASLPSGTVDAAYSATIAASGGTAPYSYTVSQGTLPAGLTLSTSGAISGTPTTAGTSSFTIQVTDSKSATATAQGSIKIAAASALTISPSTLPDGQINVAYSQTLTASGGVAPYTFAVTTGALPTGITLTGGVLSGTPTVSGTFNFTITATDSTTPTPLTGSNAYTLIISPSALTLSPATLPNGMVNVAYSQALTASGGTAPYTFSIASGGTLPPGIAFSAAGVFTGAPTTPGTYSFTVQVEDSSTPTAASASVPYTLTVVAATFTGNAQLNGQYFFREQFYDYLNASSTIAADGSARKAPARHGFFTQWAKALANPLQHHGANSNPAGHAVPAQGSFNSPIVWGAIGASLTFDGNGNITAGEYDSTSSYGATNSTLTGTYSINSDNTGTVLLYLAGSTSPLTFYISLRNLSGATGLAQNVDVIENTPLDALGDIEYGSGEMNIQDPTAFAASTFNGSFIFGARGETCYTCTQAQQGDIFSAGLLYLNNENSNTQESLADITTNFATDNNVQLSNVIPTTPDAMGRATTGLQTTGYSNGALPATYAIYVIDAHNLFMISTDPATDSNPFPAYLWGTFNLQESSVQFANSTLTGNYLAYGSTEDLANETTPDSASDAFIYLLAADGNGGLTGTGDLNTAGTSTSGVALTTNYSVASNGRATMTGGNVGNVSGGDTPIFWLVNAAGDGYGLQQTSGDTQEPGLFILRQQSGTPFSNASISGQFSVHTMFPSTGASPMLSGTLLSDGNGNLTGDLSLVTYFASDAGEDSATYAITSSGRGTVTGAANGIIGTSIVYVLTPGLVVSLDETPGDLAPAIVLIRR